MDWCGQTPTHCSIIHRHARDNAPLLYHVCLFSTLSRQPFRRDIVYLSMHIENVSRNAWVTDLSGRCREFCQNLRAIIQEKVPMMKINRKIPSSKKNHVKKLQLSLNNFLSEKDLARQDVVVKGCDYPLWMAAVHNAIFYFPRDKWCTRVCDARRAQISYCYILLNNMFIVFEAKFFRYACGLNYRARKCSRSRLRNLEQRPLRVSLMRVICTHCWWSTLNHFVSLINSVHQTWRRVNCPNCFNIIKLLKRSNCYCKKNRHIYDIVYRHVKRHRTNCLAEYMDL